MTNGCAHPDIAGATYSCGNGHHVVYSLNDHPDRVLVVQSDGLRCLNPKRSRVSIPNKARYMNALSVYHHHVLAGCGLETDMIAYGHRGLLKYLEPCDAERYADTASVRRRLQMPQWTVSVTQRLGGRLWHRYTRGEYDAGSDTLPGGMDFLSSLPYPVVLVRTPGGSDSVEIPVSVTKEISSAFTSLQRAYRDRRMEIAAMRVPCGFEQGVDFCLSADVGNPFETIVFDLDSIESGNPRRNVASTLPRLVREMESEGNPADVPLDAAREVSDGMPEYFLGSTGMTLVEFSQANLR